MRYRGGYYNIGISVYFQAVFACLQEKIKGNIDEEIILDLTE